MTSVAMGTTLRLVASAAEALAAPGVHAETEVVVVLDTTWTPPPGGAGSIVSVRDVAGRVLADWDLIAETSAHLDRWAAGSGVIDALVLRGTSFWYYVRLRHWMWLQERILWAAILARLVAEHRPAVIAWTAGVDAALRDVAPLIAARDGLATVRPPMPPQARRGGLLPRLADALALAPRVPGALRRRLTHRRRLAAVRRRLDVLAAEGGGRLLVVREHSQQLVAGPDGPRHMNPYLDPIVARLAATPLAPISLDIRAKVWDDRVWQRLGSGATPRELPADALELDETGAASGATGAAGNPAAPLAWSPVHVPVETSGIDLAPLLAADVAAAATRWLPGAAREIGRIARILARLQPAGILLADEYHRQDWLAAAHQAGIPVAAIEHGMIYPRHNGYIHAARPETLRLPQRLFVFGRWERDLLVERSVFRDDEVVVGGSPRLDLVTPLTADARAALRREMGAVDDEHLVLLSGTWGGLYRRFHYPLALASLVDRPLPGVRFVVKLHPGEPDEGPYRAIIEGAAAAGGFAPPPVSHIRSVDLYQALAAADAHLGIHSTVLTEAVVTRTPNLLADQVAAADLLGYVPARVAIPVHNGGDLLAALARGPAALAEADAAVFTDAHFEPGKAADRIAANLLGWLA